MTTVAADAAIGRDLRIFEAGKQHKRDKQVVAEFDASECAWFVYGDTYGRFFKTAPKIESVQALGGVFNETYKYWHFNGEKLPDPIAIRVDKFITTPVAIAHVQSPAAIPVAAAEVQPLNVEEKPEPGYVPPHWFVKPSWFDRVTWMIKRGRPAIALVGPAGNGKAQPMYSPIQTPNGTVTMGNMKVGAIVSTPDGKSARVIGVFPQGNKKVYRITFANGDHVDACEDHLWRVNSLDWRPNTKIVDTTYLLKNTKHPNGRRKMWIDPTEPVQMNEQAVSIPPYLMGALIGDGYFGAGNDSISLSSIDQGLIDRVRSMLEPGYRLVNHSKTHARCSFTIVRDGQQAGRANFYKAEIRNYGLEGKRSWEKSIPEVYLFNSIENRFELLRGLMDTDGDVWRGLAHFSTTSPMLAEQVKWLIHSLGGIATISEKRPTYTYKGEKRFGRISYVLQIRFHDPSQLFHLTRKASACKIRTKYPVRHFIERVELLGEMPVQCIMVDHPDHLYLTDHFIPTHNTTAAHIALQAAGYPEDKIRVLNANESITIRDLVGGNRITAEGEKYVPGFMEQAFIDGCAVILDEADSFDPRVMISLNTALLPPGQSGKDRYLATANGKVYPNGACPVIMTMNTFGMGAEGNYVGRNKADGATRNRWSIVSTTYENEIPMLKSMGIRQMIARQVVDHANGVRKKIDDANIPVILSPRDTFRIAESLEFGMFNFPHEFDKAWDAEFFDTLPQRYRVMLK